MASFKIGAGKASINPTREMLPLPAHNGFVQEEIHDDSDCRALAVETDGQTILFMTYDRGGRPHVEDLEDRIAVETGVPARNIISIGTHNHTDVHDVAHGKVSDRDAKIFADYRELEVQAGITAAKKALATLRPAKYGFGTINSYINTNRDLHTLGDCWVEGINLAGYSDKTLSVLKFVDYEGNLIAALLNYGAHATCCINAKDYDHKGKVSGNFPAYACRFVERRYGNDCVCLWTSGPAGNQNPLYAHGLQFEYEDGYTTCVPLPDGVHYTIMEYLGRQHGADASRCLEGISHYRDEMPLQYSEQVVEIVHRKRTADSCPQEQDVRMGGYGPRPDSMPYGTLPPVPPMPKFIDDPEHPGKMDMRLFILGDVALLNTNGEMYAEIGRDMKAASPYKNIMIITHSGKGRTSYIADKTAIGSRVFPALDRNTPGASDERIVEGVRKIFAKAVPVTKI